MDALLAERPLGGAVALDARFFADPAWFAVDEARVLRGGWQLATHRVDLAAPGDWVAAEVAGGSVLIAVGADGGLAAFWNVCRHRAGPVAQGKGRDATRWRCLYHGWQYGLDGRLRAAPEMGGAVGFEVSAVALAPVRVAEFQGLVFVALSDAAPPFGEVVAGIAERIAPNHLAAMIFERRVVYDVDCNWKVYIDNYLEGYHVPYIHPALTGSVDYAEYRTDLARWYSLQYTPVRDSDPAYGVGMMYYYFIYPNTMLNVVDGRLQVNRVLPDGPRRCRVEFDYYYTPEARARAADDQAFTDTVQAEDAHICATVDRNLRSGAYTGGRLCPRREAGVWHWHNLLRRAYAHA